MILLKQSTAATLRVGPAMNPSDGVTPVTTVDLSTADQAELLKATGATVDISAATFAAITGVSGWYDLSLTTSHTDTLGMLTVVVQDTSACTPMFARAMVLPANVYDSLVGGSDQLDINVLQWAGTAVPTTEAGGPGVVRRNTAQGGAAQSITLDASASATDSFYLGDFVEIIGGTGVGQGRTITVYVGASKVATVDRAWITNPDNTSVFRIIAGSLPTTLQETIDGVLDEATSGHSTAGTVGKAVADTDTNTANLPTLIGTPVADLATDIASVLTKATIASHNSGIQKNTAFSNFGFVMTDDTNHQPAAGLTVTAQRSLDGAGFAACANSVVEVSNGSYKINLATTDTNANVIMFRFSATNADDLFIMVPTKS